MERRKHSRIGLKESVEVRLCAVEGRDDLAGRLIACTTNDISAEGIRIRLDAELPVDAYVDVRITLPDPPNLFTLHGKVKWTKPGQNAGVYDVGIEIADPTDNYLEEWRHLVAKLHSRPGIAGPVKLMLIGLGLPCGL